MSFRIARGCVFHLRKMMFGQQPEIGSKLNTRTSEIFVLGIDTLLVEMQNSPQWFDYDIAQIVIDSLPNYGRSVV